MINLETPKKLRGLVNQAHQVAAEFVRPLARKYDLAEHEYPKELDMLASMVDGLGASGQGRGAGANGVRRGDRDRAGDDGVRNGTNLDSEEGAGESYFPAGAQPGPTFLQDLAESLTGQPVAYRGTTPQERRDAAAVLSSETGRSPSPGRTGTTRCCGPSRTSADRSRASSGTGRRPWPPGSKRSP